MSGKLVRMVFSLLLTAVLAGSASASLVAQWKFDEGSGSVAHDATGNGNDGTFIGAPQWVAGKIDGALEFNGTSDYIEVPFSESLRVINQGDFSIAAWFRPDEIPSEYKVIFQQGDDAAGGPGRTWLFVHQTNEIRSSLGGAPTGSGVGVEPGVWCHATVVVTEGGDNDSVQMYVNGEAAGAARQDSMEDSEGVFYIGAHKALTNFWAGLIDDLRIYNHGLSQAEITRLSVGPRASKPSPADGAIYEQSWANLSWTAGSDAASHDVYLGESFDDVNDATNDSETFRGNQTDTFLVVGFPGFPYPEGLVPGTTYYWRVDEVNDLNPESPWKGDVWSFTVPSKTAFDPSPADGVQFVSTDVTLSWKGGLAAKLHTVYFGDNFDDVDNAAGGITQTETTYDPGTLDMGKTYYWRVDEFDGVMTHKGDTWSFSTVPIVPVTDDPSLVAWWTFNEDTGTTAVDWSGYGHHGTLLGDPPWVQGYDGSALQFAGVSGQRVEIFDYDGVLGTQDRTTAAWIKTAGLGAIVSWGQTVTGQKWIFRVQADNGNSGAIRVECEGGRIVGFTDVRDDEWHHVAAVLQSAGAPTMTDIKLYLDGTEETISDSVAVDIDTVGGRNVWIGDDQHDRPFPGLIDDVRIYDRALSTDDLKLAMRIDPSLAWNPSPSNGSKPDADAALPLSWSPGNDASQHDVCFGLDEDAVTAADATDTTGIYRGRQNATTYTPPEGVEWGGGPYYWRVDEFNTDGTITKGRIWSFSVADFILVDDFESYTDNDAADQAIWQHWIDGFGVADNGGQVGYLLPPYAEQTIVHSGNQSMPFMYDNTAGVTNSEATLALTAPRDWSRHGLTDLSLWFRGYPASVGSFVEAPAGTYTMTGSGADVWGVADQFHFAFKTLTGAGSIVARVNSVQSTNDWAKAGVMIRETLDAGSKHAFACVTPANGVASQGRTATDSTSFSTNETGITAPHWVKLERDAAGNFTVSHSTNGTTWQSVANAVPTNIPMLSSVYIGLAVTSHDAAQTCQAVFSNITTTGNVSGQWQHQDVGITSNAAEPMYVQLSNANGTSAIVANDDPAAATVDTWTEWRIPLAAFADQGISLADVDSIAIGLGTKAGVATSGGSGTVYFDDIRLYPPAP